ncbi:MAG: class I SAM-dependent methyltransferase [Planctomycetes bacterium]|nr:class I SAM-dependent methyltransferase [Planctomycetota bacterium]
MALTYSTFGLLQVLRQAAFALRRGDGLRQEVEVLAARLRRDQARMRAFLGRELRGLDVLELGPGQHCARARVLGQHNRVTAVDLDEVLLGVHPRAVVEAARKNGAGRVVKTLARKALGVDRAMRRAWAEAAGARSLPDPRLVRADVCAGLPLAPDSFDVVASWSVFEHLPDPARALEHAIAVLRPGGVLCIGIHLFTANNGHHDIRAFTGDEGALPPWAHLRPGTRHLVRPSAVLNGWRLSQWRALFEAKAPGAAEFQERYGEDRLREALTPELRAELVGYDDEELLTVDVFYLWRKPAAVPVVRPAIPVVAAVHEAATASQARPAAPPAPVDPVRVA